MSTYGFGEIGDRELNKANIFRLVREEVLWRHYLGFDFVVGKTYKSPLRTDPNPSFSIFMATRLGKIMARDHGGQFAGDIIDYICFTERIDFYSALIKINLDFGLGLNYSTRDRCMTFRMHSVGSVPRLVAPKSSVVVYDAKHRPPLQSDIDYWASYGITRPTLRLYGVLCVNSLYCNGGCCYTYQPGDPCYEYPFPSGNRKYYRPFADKANKFRGNISNDTDMQGYYRQDDGVWLGLDDWCNGDVMVLTKSMKDIMLLREYGVDAMAIHGETQKFNPDFIRHIKKRYSRVVSLYDRDKAGVCGARYLWREYGIEAIFIKSAKDITDLYRKDKEKADEFVRKRIRR